MGVGFAASAGATFLVSQLADGVREWAGPASAGVAVVLTQVASVVIVFVLDAVIVALLFIVLAGVRANARAIIPGALVGGVGLTVLGELSFLFVRGASSNPLLASFASLIALLLWLNLSAQVLLIACSYIIVGVAEQQDRVRARHGSPTMAHRRVQRAEDAVRTAVAELDHARAGEQTPGNSGSPATDRTRSCTASSVAAIAALRGPSSRTTAQYDSGCAYASRSTGTSRSS
ncbi:YhjD/YihY/BrkB family envelope integrity protein [Microbacterium elymi]|uniref:YhjD/YihY/BrkB family envelope integrity protein n=1 Tax=Microbacterium elymi TaxID=2909587 RepID=UPI00338DBD8F